MTRARASVFRGFSIVLLLVALSARGLDGVIANNKPSIVEFGTFTQVLVQCDQQKIFLGQASPVTINIPAAAPAATNVQYILVDGSGPTYPTGGITATISAGGIGTTRVTLKITNGVNKSVFLGDIVVSSFCA